SPEPLALAAEKPYLIFASSLTHKGVTGLAPGSQRIVCRCRDSLVDRRSLRTRAGFLRWRLTDRALSARRGTRRRFGPGLCRRGCKQGPVAAKDCAVGRL